MFAGQFPLAQLLISIALILVTRFVYKVIIRPYRTYMFYKKVLVQNYKTYFDSFSILGMQLVNRIQQDQQKHNDANYFTKRQLINYQVELMKIGPDILIDLIDPQLIREFYQKAKEGYYVKSFSFPPMATILQVIGEGLVFSENQSWKKKKKILSNIFNFDFLHSKISYIAQITQNKLNTMQMSKQNGGKQIITVQLLSFFQTILGNVISKFFFGDLILDSINGQDFFNFINIMLQRNAVRSLTPYAFIMGSTILKYGFRQIDRDVNRRHKQFILFAEKNIQKIIKQSKKQKIENKKIELKQKGLIWWIINQQMLSKETSQQKYSYAELINQITTFFIAGTETTSIIITMVIYKLSEYPQIFKKVKNQIKQNFGDKEFHQLTLQKLKQFHYLQKVIKEVLRMFPPLTNILPRQIVKDHYLGKIPMKKGTLISVQLLSNQYKPQFYTNPLQFNPDRWDTIDQSKAQTFSYFPFSSGYRVCIGQQLSLHQTKITLILLLRRYKDIRLQNINYKLRDVITYAPQKMNVYLTKE